jgi:hypothetical protein
MGFTPFPGAFTLAAVEDAWSVVARDADLVLLHYDDGVPWEEALAGALYPHDAELRDQARRVPGGHVVYVAVTPLAFLRDGLAPRRGASGSEALRPPWDRKALDDPDVVAAFGSHCLEMIERFAPRYFAYAIEANMLQALAPAQWPAFLRLAEQVYTRVKAAHPSLPVFVTLQVEFVRRDPAGQAAALQPLLPFTDLIAVSSYPFSVEPDPRRLPRDYLAAVAGLAPAKRFAVAETCWPAEDVTAPSPAFIPGSEDAQRAWVEQLLAEAGERHAAFVTYFFTRDYDGLWETHLREGRDAALLRLWKDCGLYAGDGRARSALSTWRAVLARPSS